MLVHTHDISQFVGGGYCEQKNKGWEKFSSEHRKHCIINIVIVS